MNFLKRKFLLSLALIITLCFTLASHLSIFAASLFSDDFSNSVLSFSQWQVFGTSGAPAWHIVNGEYGIHIDGNFIVTNTYPIDNVWSSAWVDYDFQVDLRGVEGTDKNVAFRYINEQNFYEIHHTGGNIYLDKLSSLGNKNLGKVVYSLLNGQVYHVRILVQGSKINVWINGNVIFNVNDNSNPLLQGKIALRAGTGATAPTEVWFDNVVVRDLPSPTPTPTPLPSLNVPDVKQYTEPWGNQIYDNATSWSSYPTIARWGCALTSADMVLQYHGFNINPGELNTWLLDQPDGYLRNGYLNWLSISRYSKLNKNANQLSLEFSRLPGTNDNLIKELKEGRPGIVEEIGHFVVVKSQTQSSFGINDPAYSDKLTLDSYGNNFKSIESYKPSSTDLSYIMLVLDPQFDLKVYKDDGSEVAGNTYIQEPIIDDINGDLNGSSLKIFMLAYPPHGTYNVEVNGRGAYILDSYLYDPEGKLVKTNLNGIVSDNNSDKYQIKIGQENSISSLLTLNSIMNDWNSLGFPNKNIITLLNNSVKLVAKGNVVAAKSNLGGAIEYLQENTPSLIDPLISQILQAEIGEYKNAI